MSTRRLLMGDEAVAFGATDGGLRSAYGYPGTPSTEIIATLIERAESEMPDAPSGGYVSKWCTNEKAAYEEALGASIAGARAMVTMKHVGLNVAADPFVNSALLEIAGGLLVAVADDPGMHSSQNEQDSRHYADFARTVCLEPADQQESYEMAREAFELSEELQLPVLLRLVTRVAHARGVVNTDRNERRAAANDVPPAGGAGWMLLPVNARRQWVRLLERQPLLVAHRLASRFNRYTAGDPASTTAVVSCGVGREYYRENEADLDVRPHHVHIGYYPFGEELFGKLPKTVRRVLVLEDGYPYVERLLRGMLQGNATIEGRESGALPAAGELTPETVRAALGLAPLATPNSVQEVPARPPQLCAGCPHADSFKALNAAAPEGLSLRTSDIGCYALGALPPHSIADSVVCMGASIGMAKGAAEAGVEGVVATIGDSTFLHSGIPALIDAVEAQTPITVLILDNSTVAMTGGQPPASTRIGAIVAGIGVDPDHIVTLTPVPAKTTENAELIRRELSYRGPSVIIAQRACVRFAPKTKRSAG